MRKKQASKQTNKREATIRSKQTNTQEGGNKRKEKRKKDRNVVGKRMAADKFTRARNQ